MRWRARAVRIAIAGACLTVGAAGCGASEREEAPYEVAYTATSADGGAALFFADLDGGRVRRVSAAGETVSGFEWSPDGERLAYAGCEGEASEPRCTLFTIDADGRDRQRLGEGSSPHWSPDGWRIAFVKPRSRVDELYVTDRDRDAPRLKTAGLDAGSGGGVIATGASPWSPDGRTLAVTRRSDSVGGSEVVLVRGDGEQQSRVAAEPGGVTFGGWSPDGGRMVLLGTWREGRWRLFVAESDGSGLRAAGEAAGERSDGVRLAWSLDGTRIAVASGLGVAVLDAATSAPQWSVGGACEGVGGVEWSPGETVWFTRGCEQATRVLVARDLVAGTERAAPLAALEFALRPG